MLGSSRCRLTQPNGGDPPPSLHRRYTRFVTTTGRSAPVRRIATFGLAVDATCAFSLSIAGQVLNPYSRRLTISFFSSAIALAGFSPFGHAFVQFKIVWQR